MGIERVSWNINGGNWPQKTYWYDFLFKYQPTTLLVMDNYNAAIELADGLAHTKIVHRSYSDDDAQFWNPDPQPNGHIAYQSPETVVAREVAWGHPEIWRQVLNEPPVGDKRLISWLVEVARLFSERGYKAVLGNFSVGSYQPQHIESGYFDPLLDALEFSEHYWGCHEYTSILLPFGVGQWSFEQLYTKSDCQPEFWPTNLPIKRVGANLPGYWHLLRSSWLTIRAHDIGLAAPRYWVTEFGWDALSDMGDAGALDHFKNTYGIPAPHNSLRGVNTLAPIWRDYFPQWSHQVAAFEQLKWAESIYPENYVGFNLFTINGNHDWKIDAGCDFSELYELNELLLSEKQSTPTPVPEPTPIPPKETHPMPDPTPNPTPAPAPTSSILAWVMVNGVILIILFALFLVMRSSTALASQDVSTLPISLEQAASMILAVIVSIVMGGVQVPVVTPLTNLLKWGFSYIGWNVSADRILLGVSAFVTIVMWIAARLGLGFQLDSVFSILVTVLPMLFQLLNSLFGSKAVYADAVRSQVSAFGYQRTA